MVFIFLVLLIFGFFIFAIFNRQYIFENNNLIIKSIFSIRTNKFYDLNNLSGYSYRYYNDFEYGSSSFLLLYFEDRDEIKIKIKPKNEDIIKYIVKQNHNSIVKRNIDKINISGMKYQIFFNTYKYIVFKKDCIEIIFRNGIVEIYYYKKDIKNLIIKSSIPNSTSEKYKSYCEKYLENEFKNNKTIKIWDYELQGGVGLFYYLMEKRPNGT